MPGDRLAFWCGMLGLSIFGQAGRFTMDEYLWSLWLLFDLGELTLVDLVSKVQEAAALDAGIDGQ